jgi:Ca2+/Na+ antiporter
MTPMKVEDEMGDRGMNGVVFGATFLAAATALPEISTGITGVRLQRYTLVFGDMFGGNAFQLTLFWSPTWWPASRCSRPKAKPMHGSAVSGC